MVLITIGLKFTKTGYANRGALSLSPFFFFVFSEFVFLIEGESGW